jgi:hypothetical protein
MANRMKSKMNTYGQESAANEEANLCPGVGEAVTDGVDDAVEAGAGAKKTPYCASCPREATSCERERPDDGSNHTAHGSGQVSARADAAREAAEAVTRPPRRSPPVGRAP